MSAVSVRVEKSVAEGGKYKVMVDDAWVGPTIDEKSVAERVAEFMYAAIADGEIKVTR
jgi:hypothetical protein